MTDPGGKPPLTLDKAWIEKFLNVDIEEFQAELKKIRTESGPYSPISLVLAIAGMPMPDWMVPTMAMLAGGAAPPDSVAKDAPWPLMIGPMAGEGDTVGGAEMSKRVSNMATELHGFLSDQVTLFRDIEENLRDSIDSLFSAEGDSLEKIDGQKLIDALEDVEDDLAAENSGSSSGV
ncbi:type VII secretion system-associated protein [Streptomyces sp. 3N207]|uniref:type VII secretion system-associated protein n=1 Tax=Streptomyces sp. 3N207 TaxID=3457417 RepID=UPI003FD0DDA5